MFGPQCGNAITRSQRSRNAVICPSSHSGGPSRIRASAMPQRSAAAAYSTAHGPCVEGDRMIVGLMRMKAGTGAEPHSHPNEQWIYVLEGTFRAAIDGKELDVRPGQVVYIPANKIHAGKATAEGDVLFFTVKDASHSLHGIKAS